MDNNNQWQQQPVQDNLNNLNNLNQLNQQQFYNQNTNCSGQTDNNSNHYTINRGQLTYNVHSQPNDKKTLSTVTLILGILSVTICCCIGIIPGTIAIIVGIVALIKEPRGRLISGIGIALSVVAVILSLIVVLSNIGVMLSDTINSNNDIEDATEELKDSLDDLFEDDYDYDYDYDYDDTVHFWGSRYIGSDDSVIYFYDDDTFHWFRYDYDYDNLNSGEYKVLFGEDARDWLVYEHPEYGVTTDELDDYSARNSDEELYSEENLTILILESTEIIQNGEISDRTPYTTYYYGYSNEEGFDGVNLKTFNPMVLYNDY